MPEVGKREQRGASSCPLGAWVLTDETDKGYAAHTETKMSCHIGIYIQERTKESSYATSILLGHEELVSSQGSVEGCVAKMSVKRSRTRRGDVGVAWLDA